jgi:asparagine synthase (glutamine-hydrolysing)
MCGIVGALLLNPVDGTTEEMVEHMTHRLLHRGPDAQRIYVDGRVALGFRRLSIVDPLSGHQPVVSEDEDVVVICNGEIYNHARHRQELERRGHRFNSGSDAEVIPHLYEEHGDAFVGHLHGKFAIALYDRARQRVILVRDRLGIKPLYYVEIAGELYFSSEIKSLLLVPGLAPSVDRTALDHVLTFKHTLGAETLLEGVRTLRPGHYVTVDLSSMRRTRQAYYEMPWEPHRPVPTIDNAQAEILRLFDRAVAMRLMSDVPIAVALSGGLDSSSVAASVALQAGKPPMTFAVDTAGAVDDLRFARMVADRYKTDHHEVRFAPENIPALVDDVMWHAEEFFSVSELPTYYLGQAAHRHVKVLLCGDGADELFGGYSRFQPINMLPFLPKSLITWGYVRGLNGYTRGERRPLYSATQRAHLGRNSNLYLDQALGQTERPVLDRLLHYEMTQQLPQHQLMRLDKLTMAHGVEARVPFLDSDLVGYVVRLPSSYKVRGFREKVLLKRVMADRLPEPVIRRRKYGLTTPVKPLFQNGLRDVCQTEFRESRGIIAHYFELAAVQRLLRNRGRSLLSIPEQKLFQIYLFLKWHRLFIEGPSSIRPWVPRPAIPVAS